MPGDRDQPNSISNDRFRIEFTRHDDRYARTIHLNSATEATTSPQFIPLLESVEGSSQEPWPASPPLQSLHFENRPDGRQVALLVGMSGDGHWSMSVELPAAASQAAQAPTKAAEVVFDVACRTRSVPHRLGSHYRALLSQAIGTGPGSVLVQSEDSGGTMLLCNLTLDDIPESACRIASCTSGEFRLELLAPVNQVPATYRWRYRLKALR